MSFVCQATERLAEVSGSSAAPPAASGETGFTQQLFDVVTDVMSSKAYERLLLLVKVGQTSIVADVSLPGTSKSTTL